MTGADRLQAAPDYAGTCAAVASSIRKVCWPVAAEHYRPQHALAYQGSAVWRLVCGLHPDKRRVCDCKVCTRAHVYSEVWQIPAEGRAWSFSAASFLTEPVQYPACNSQTEPC